jgi:hypothetical protein
MGNTCLGQIIKMGTAPIPPIRWTPPPPNGAPAAAQWRFFRRNVEKLTSGNTKETENLRCSSNLLLRKADTSALLPHATTSKRWGGARPEWWEAKGGRSAPPVATKVRENLMDLGRHNIYLQS